jgi:hypothetical protein
MSSPQPEYANRPLPSSNSSTVPFNHPDEPASRLLEKLDQLTAKVDHEVQAGLAVTMPAPSAQPAPHQPPAHLPAANNPDDECLDAYLQKYMQRLTGKMAVEPAPAAGAASSAPPAKSEQPESAAPEPIRQPTQAPERRSQISAIRDLAIDSARRAVSESSQIQRIISARRSYMQAKLASLASIVIAIAYFATHAPLALTGSLLLFAVAVVLSVRFALLFRTATAENE